MVSGGTILDKRQLGRSAAAAIVVLCLIIAMLVPVVPSRAEPYDVTDDPIMCVTGHTEDAKAGRSIAFLDIDHDGVGDLVVGAPGDSSGGENAGKVMIYLGDEVKTDPDVEIIGSAEERFGFSVARAGDVNSDGIDDLIVGAPSNDTGGLDFGTAYIILGAEDVDDLPEAACDADVVIQGVVARGQLGYSVSTAGDVNSDNHDDVLVGAPYCEAGVTYLLYGGDPMNAVMDKTFSGLNPGDQFGFSVAGGMNLDGSAQPDAVIGAPGSSSSKGAVRVILNPAKTTPKVVTLTGATVGDRFGTSVAVLDFNGDLCGDVAVGSPKAASVGKAFVFYGSTVSGRFDRSADVTFSIGAAGDMFGLSVAGGDPRTDKIGDLMVGAPMNDSAAIDAGRAYTFYGNATADAVPDVVVEGSEAEGWFGLSVATGSNLSADYDDDGDADFAVGAPSEGENGEGAVYLYSGIRVIVPADPEVFGYVLDAVSDAGLSNAIVTMTRVESPHIEETAKTTANGSYGLVTPISLPPGTYWINVSYDEYFDASQQHELDCDTRTNVSFAMDRLPIVQGVIYDGNSTGDFLEDALVEVRDSSDELLDELTTGPTGAYYFVLDTVGDISITVTKEYYFDGLMEFTVACNEDITTDLTLNHYPIVVVSVEDTEGDEIVGVKVEVSIDGELLATGETDDAGLVLLMVPGEDTAYVNSSKVGYVPDSQTVDLEANVLEEVSVTMNTQPSISGTIKDALFEAPVSGASVALYESGSTVILDSDTSDIYGFYSFDVVDEGTYDLRVTAIGYIREFRPSVTVVADEAATEDFWLDTDTIPPTSEISDPQPGLLCITSEFKVYANATDPNGNDIQQMVLFYSHEGKPYMQWGDPETEGPYVFVFDSSDAHGDGIYEFYTIAKDCAGNVETTPVGNDTWIAMNSGVPVSKVDELDPYQSDESFVVKASGSDPFGVQYVELWYGYDGGDFEKYGQDSVFPYSWDFVADDGDGVYAFYSILVNGIGQTELPPDDPDTSTILDTTVPTAAITSPEEDAALDTGTVVLEATITDDGAGLDFLTYEVDDEDAVVVEIDDGDSSYGLSVTLQIEDGEHTIVATATDLLGWESSDEVTFSVDTTAPELTIIHPVDGSAVNTVDVEVSWSVEDEVSGVDETEVRIDGGSWETIVGTSKLFEDLGDDFYTVEVRATDFAGNDVTESTTFEVDTIAPTVYITSPSEGQVLTTSLVVVKWEQSDIGSGIDKVEARIDGGEWKLTVTNSTEFAFLSDGSHTVDVRATDKAGNTDTDTVTFEISDNTAPEVTISSPEDGEILDVDSVTAEWTVTDEGTGIYSVEYKLDSAAWTTTTATGSLELTDLAEGAHTFSVRAEDNADNIVVETAPFVVDTLAPTVEITSPSDGEVLSSEDALVEYTADGTGTDIVSVERRVDGGTWESAGETSTLVESLDEGDHSVDIRATDEAGHQATASVAFSVDLGPPVITITSPEDDAVLTTDSVTVEWTVSDPGATVDVKLDDGDWEVASGDSATFTDLANGEHTVVVRATDAAENNATDSVTFTVSVTADDSTPPVVAITSPANGADIGSTSVNVTWTASDGTGSGVATVEFMIDSGAWTAVTGTSRALTGLAQGSHTVSVRATDNAGNTATASVTFMVDTVAPTLSITSPEDGWDTSETSVTVEWTCTDAGCGVNRVEIRLDDGSYVAVTTSERTFSNLEAGEHTADVRAYDKAGNMVEASVTFSVSDEGGGINALLIGGIVLAVIIVAAIAVMLMRRKRAGTTPPPTE